MPTCVWWLYCGPYLCVRCHHIGVPFTFGGMTTSNMHTRRCKSKPNGLKMHGLLCHTPSPLSITPSQSIDLSYHHAFASPNGVTDELSPLLPSHLHPAEGQQRTKSRNKTCTYKACLLAKAPNASGSLNPNRKQSEIRADPCAQTRRAWPYRGQRGSARRSRRRPRERGSCCPHRPCRQTR